jgi:hypothetical protein
MRIGGGALALDVKEICNGAKCKSFNTRPLGCLNVVRILGDVITDVCAVFDGY